jgi:hypothetical protein
MQVISWAAEWLLASQKGLCCMKLVGWLVSQSVSRSVGQSVSQSVSYILYTTEVIKPTTNPI